MSILNMVDAFGRLPVKYRQWIRHIVAFTDSSTNAYAVNAEIIFQKSCHTPTIWIHESSYIMDAYAIQVNGGRYSQSQEWVDAVNQDPDVPDPYSNSNLVEDFAQVCNIAMFDKVVPGGFGTVEPKWNQVLKQYTTVQRTLGERLSQGGTCTRRWSDSAIVAIPTRPKAATGPKPTYMPKNNSTKGPDPVIVKGAPNMPIVYDDYDAGKY